MKIVFTGGGTGGHFYPIIAVAEELTEQIEQAGYLDIELFYISSEPYDQELLDKHNIKYIELPTGKNRVYFSFKNVTDFFKIAGAIIRSFFILFHIFPDVIFTKGGYPSFPVMVVARFLRIPVIVHESDTVPGRANLYAAKFAEKIAVSYPEAAAKFPQGKTAHTGNPVRREILNPIVEGSHQALDLQEGVPTIFVVGGSQGAQMLNEIMLRTAPKLLDTYQVIHMVGPKNFDDFQAPLSVAIGQHPNKKRYKSMSYMDAERIRQAAGIADIVVSRAGSALFEIAAWGTPSIIVPITKSNGDHQKRNAYAYAREGACTVIEEINLSPSIFIAEIDRIHNDPQTQERMRKAAQSFGSAEASGRIAEQIMNVIKRHKN
jgi:UDP-N-acetylglucosamine--N-acetylmuramyl-(pentapeptide) pyrophosphoryl-undecaprenol N-acetylglucosamine transferase